MNKRQSKKQELSSQVDDLQNISSLNMEMNSDTNVRIDNIVDRTNTNFKFVAKEIAETDSNINLMLDAQKKETSEVRNNRFAILDMQNHIKSLWKISIIQSLAIIALSIALVWKG
ncbi:hypothetical protein G7084_00260 [Weissella coleopterorum]|uniref:Uncharacterized protein n=1 Tax=Weissella coleopterorum TaxID=2714949 RepID=A0A6G8AY60_9LACO|nr:hypothetical protein [Weissella coleopterorum]QIL49892.1 hypothetical protein G7084_00260 [Weissella coleopterorum]